ncbi:putative programmed cell death protein [Helianthus annuus]|nr:putative programmed cell death protein [Helianthus annuus]
MRKLSGGGGKGTGEKLLDTDGEPHIDRSYPNYDSGERTHEWLYVYEILGAVSDPLDEYKRKVASIIDEYFSTGDVDLAISELKELGSADYHPSLRDLCQWPWTGMIGRKKWPRFFFQLYILMSSALHKSSKVFLCFWSLLMTWRLIYSIQLRLYFICCSCYC